jgi:hypothetical protein
MGWRPAQGKSASAIEVAKRAENRRTIRTISDFLAAAATVKRRCRLELANRGDHARERRERFV